MKLVVVMKRTVKSKQSADVVSAQGDYCKVGRSNCQFTVPDPKASKDHAVFYCDSATNILWIKDLGSKNGTLVNGEKVEKHKLKVGDEVTIGDTVLEILSFDLGHMPWGTAAVGPEDDELTESQVRNSVVKGWPGAYVALPPERQKAYENFVDKKDLEKTKRNKKTGTK